MRLDARSRAHDDPASRGDRSQVAVRRPRARARARRRRASSRTTSSTSRRTRTRCRRWSRSSRSRDGWSAEEVERYVTVPLEIGLAGHARARSHALAVALRALRREVLLRLGHRLRGGAPGGHQPPPVRPRCPTGVQAQLSPWNAIGEVFRYTRARARATRSRTSRPPRTGSSSASSSRSRASSTSSSFGGETKQYHVDVDPLPPARPRRDARRSSSTAIQNGEPERRRPAPRHRRAVATTSAASACFAERARHREHRRRRAEGHAGPRARRRRRRRRPRAAPRHRRPRRRRRRRPGHRPHALRRRDARRRSRASTSASSYIRENHLLPPGMEIEPYYDRGNLVKLTTHTVIENLLVGHGARDASCSSSSSGTRAPRSSRRSTSRSRCSIAFCGLVAHAARRRTSSRSARSTSASSSTRPSS